MVNHEFTTLYLTELNSLFRSLRLDSLRLFLHNQLKIVFHWSILFIYYFMVSIIFDIIPITSKIILALRHTHTHRDIDALILNIQGAVF